jgi:hypothetical protein
MLLENVFQIPVRKINQAFPVGLVDGSFCAVAGVSANPTIRKIASAAALSSLGKPDLCADRECLKQHSPA